MITCLLVIKINRSLFHFGDLALAVANLGDLLVLASILLIDSLLLCLQVFEQEILDNTKG